MHSRTGCAPRTGSRRASRCWAPVRASATSHSPPPLSVADVTSAPCACFSTVSAKGLRRIEPMAMQPDIKFAALDPVDREPVDEIRCCRAADPREQREPGGRPSRPASRSRRSAPSIRARAGPSIQSGASASTASSRRPSVTSGRTQRVERLGCRRGSLDQRGVRLGEFGFEAIARIACPHPRGHKRARAPRRAGSRPARTARPRSTAGASLRSRARPPP